MKGTTIGRIVLNALLMVALLSAPLTVLAQEEPGNVGTAVALSLIGLVLIVIFAVAVIAAVSLGIIGIGYAVSQSDEG